MNPPPRFPPAAGAGVSPKIGIEPSASPSLGPLSLAPWAFRRQTKSMKKAAPLALMALMLAAPGGAWAIDSRSEDPFGGDLGKTLEGLRSKSESIPSVAGAGVSAPPEDFDIPPLEDPLIAANSSGRAGPGICQHSWEERPGTADYTLWDSYSKKRLGGADRPQSATLQGNPAYKSLTICARARLLKRCFERALHSGSPAARSFRNWASARGIDPVRALIAKAAQETRLGAAPDSCEGRSCNGIGLMQVITAIGPDGSVISNRDPRWTGITHNILTNIEYGLRVVNEKLPGAGNLHDLAYRYNGSSYQEEYAKKVVKYYGNFGNCGL